MPNRYMDRKGIFNEENRDVVKANDLANLEMRNQQFRENNPPFPAGAGFPPF
jgi:hypothetical protein